MLASTQHAEIHSGGVGRSPSEEPIGSMQMCHIEEQIFDLPA